MEMTANVVADANRVLEFLAAHAQANWTEVLTQVLPESEVDSNVERINEKLAHLDLLTPVGAVAGGTAVFKDETGIEGEHAQNAVALLKEQFRLHQCGRGRGKALVILSPEPLEGHVAHHAVGTAVTPAQAQGDDTDEVPQDVPAMLRHASDAYRAQQTRIAQLEKALAEREAAMMDLRQKLEQVQLTTWP